MNDSFNDGDVVICDSGQSGCLVGIDGQDVWVLLKNGDIWIGSTKRLRKPQDQADLDACPLDVERNVKPEKIVR